MAHTEPKELQNRLHGVHVIMVTPFDEERRVSIPMVGQLTDFLIEKGIREGTGVLVALGSMSECFSVNSEERESIVAAAVEQAAGRVPVVVGCNATDTGTVIEYCRSAQEQGADGVLVMPPFYFPPSDEEIVEFYHSVTSSIDIGVVLYNNVQVCVDIPLKVLDELADLEKIVGLKDCTPDFFKFKFTVQALSDRLLPLNGGGPLTEPQATLAGTRGYYTLAGNFAPELAVRLWKACADGEYEPAEMLSRRFNLFIRFMREVGKSIQLTKSIMRAGGLPGGYERPPLLPLTEEQANAASEIQREMGLEA